MSDYPTRYVLDVFTNKTILYLFVIFVPFAFQCPGQVFLTQLQTIPCGKETDKNISFFHLMGDAIKGSLG